MSVKKKYIYNIKDIMQILDIGRNSAYKLIQSDEIPYKRIGKNYKIPALTFHNWLNGKINGEKVLQNATNYDIITAKDVIISGECARPVGRKE